MKKIIARIRASLKFNRLKLVRQDDEFYHIELNGVYVQGCGVTTDINEALRQFALMEEVLRQKKSKKEIIKAKWA
jgi:hypothetical protein